MKKIVSLSLAAIMLLSACPMVYAADVDYAQGTAVEYTADSDANRDYTITVPASLAPGESGTVTLSGTWASDETVAVTADATVTLTNGITDGDEKILDITFAGIEEAGDNNAAQTFTETVSVAAMPSDALFGTWSGKFNYNVEFVKEWDYSVSQTGTNTGVLTADIDDETLIVTLSPSHLVFQDNVEAYEISVTFNGEELALTTNETEDGPTFSFQSQGVGTYNLCGRILYVNGAYHSFTYTHDDGEVTETFLIITAE